MFVATAAGLYNKIEKDQTAMNSGFACKYVPDIQQATKYTELKQYLAIGNFIENVLIHP